MEEKIINGVKCTVSNCEYWLEQNGCRAGQILVTHASPLISADRHGMNAEQLQQTPAEEVTETCCYTFEPAEE
jgi:hypothetical protein